MVGKARTSAIVGLEACPVTVEAQVGRGKKNFTLIGLGDGAVREARDRVSSAIENSGFRMPECALVNLAPAGLKKEGSSFDLPIALSILAASGQIKPLKPGSAFHGELALDGSIRGINGTISYALGDFESGCSEIIVPRHNHNEAALISEISVVSASNLAALVKYLFGGPAETPPLPPRREAEENAQKSFDDVWGQESAKRAMTIAAAGGHNLLMVGPPGCGKSMLAERFPALLPPLSRQEMFEVVRVHSILGLPIHRYLAGTRPFRAPHHVVSDVGLVGGGPNLRPGEISLAHNGVLFLDEFTEYRKFALECLRAPLETGQVVISRAKGSALFPAKFQLIAAMNACPCGRLGSESEVCVCSAASLASYRQRVSQPILERIDLHLSLRGVPLSLLSKKTEPPKSSGHASLKEKVKAARARQQSRQGKNNSQLLAKEMSALIRIEDSALKLLDKAASKLGISARSYVRTLRVAATIADLEGAQSVMAEHAAEALSFRQQEGRLKSGIAA